MAMALIRTEGLSRHYLVGGKTLGAVRDVSVTVQSGEMVAVMGPSGSGKSTLLSLLGCLDRPSGGVYELDGQEVTRLSDDELATVRARRIGFVFQSFHLMPRASALENVELPLIYADVPTTLRVGLATRALARVGLAERLDHRPAELSGGEQQRVAIARALVNEPRLVLADEPTGALDSRTGREVLNLFEELNLAGITVVLVTHEPAVARRAERVVRLRDGRIVGDQASLGRRNAFPQTGQPELMRP